MIREAQEKDIPAILDIYNEAILFTTSLYHYDPHSLEQMKQWYNQKQESGFPVLVFEGEEDGLVYGFATYGSFRPHAAYQYTVEHSVYVHSDYRKKGLGTKLLKAIIKLAEEQEYATLVAGIDAVNTNSIAVHERLGFVHSGTIRRAGYKFDKWLDLAFYQLDLPGPKA
ncbi:GNAT family N-acetyltransferase [Alkalicoccobacillus porphyridii]|uniref:N-acetyltransferase n=1 Tax=Alkalicoccobacillus porphyridii TaxID=2597270 RepID=A0A553ZYI0_9BACI|nr:GNAT family N-acetyltransferase [Alkalicoccobacillus porphyridii]TSB46494.1 N-acetyltransferase [Alkalicoccobacillus porphyridii]